MPTVVSGELRRTEPLALSRMFLFVGDPLVSRRKVQLPEPLLHRPHRRELSKPQCHRTEAGRGKELAAAIVIAHAYHPNC